MDFLEKIKHYYLQSFYFLVMAWCVLVGIVLTFMYAIQLYVTGNIPKELIIMTVILMPILIGVFKINLYFFRKNKQEKTGLQK